MITEAEASAKWCPFSRVMNTAGGGGGNRWDRSGAPAAGPDGSLCLGSDCMAWRQAPLIVGGSLHEIAGPRKGYCGMAGQCAS